MIYPLKMVDLSIVVCKRLPGRVALMAPWSSVQGFRQYISRDLTSKQLENPK